MKSKIHHTGKPEQGKVLEPINEAHAAIRYRTETYQTWDVQGSDVWRHVYKWKEVIS
jgi:SLT domain-containing protein